MAKCYMYYDIPHQIGIHRKISKIYVDMSSIVNSSCSGPKPPTFVFNTVGFQTAANTVYTAKQVFDTNPANIAKNKVQTFKSDYERMQYKIGLYGLTATGNA
jgi:hypothetical protein